MSIHTAFCSTPISSTPERVVSVHVPGRTPPVSRRTVNAAMVAWPHRSTSSAGVK